MNLGGRLDRLEGSFPEKRRPNCGLTLEQLQDAEVRTLAGDYAAMMARPGGYDPDALAALKAKLDARLKMLDDERDGGGEAQ